MPNRVLRDWTDSERVDGLSWQAEVVFLRLIMKSDDFGRFSANPKLIKSMCFPLKDGLRDADISRFLAECEKAGLLRVYRVGSKSFLEILNFRQRTRASESKNPGPSSDDSHMTVVCQSHDRHPRTETETETETETYPPEDGGEVLQALQPAVHPSAVHREKKNWGDENSEENSAGMPEKRTERPVALRVYAIPGQDSTGCANWAGKLNSDYSAVSVPVVRDYEDFAAISDPIVLAMSVSGDRDRRSWLGWVKLLSASRKRVGAAVAGQKWRDECASFWGEMRSGEEVRNPGAALTARLKEALS